MRVPVGREAGLVGFLTPSRLRLYAHAIALVDACFFASVYRAGSWVIGPNDAPIYTDFAADESPQCRR